MKTISKTPEENRNSRAKLIQSAINVLNKYPKEYAIFLMEQFIVQQKIINECQKNKFSYTEVWENYIFPLTQEIYNLKNNITDLKDGNDVINFKDEEEEKEEEKKS